VTRTRTCEQIGRAPYPLPHRGCRPREGGPRFFGGGAARSAGQRPRGPADTSTLRVRRPAERFAAYADAGATWLVLTAIGDDWHAQWELIAEPPTLFD
jgi:hypothetical protein